MITVAALCGCAGLVVGLSSNVRTLILVVLLLSFAAFIAGGSQERSILDAVAWSVTALVSSQVGYIAMVILRTVWSIAQGKYRQPVPY
jgi:ABC-type iron transport system FetAB permease component